MSHSSTSISRLYTLPLLEDTRMGAFIGQKGKNLKEVEKRHKVIIKILPNQSINLIGPSECAVEQAIIDLERLTLELFSSGCTHVINVPSNRIGFLIGRRGMSINDIKSKSGVKIEISREEGDGAMVPITLHGDYSMIHNAIKMIVGRLDDFGKKNLYSDTTKKEFFESWDEVMPCN